jgi:hypothetical protein
VAALAQRPDAGDLAPPLDALVGEGVEQDAAQVCAEHFGAPPRAVVGLVEQHLALLVEDARRLGALVDDRAELLGEPGVGQRALLDLLVDVEPAALRAGRGTGIGLVDRRRDAVDMQYPGEGQAAETGADDGDRAVDGVHGRPHSPAAQCRAATGSLWTAVP